MELIHLDFTELIGVFLNLAYLVLLIKRSIFCWPMGILGSALSIYIFLDTQLYSEAILYSFYVLIGIYGWVKWEKNSDKNHQVLPKKWRLKHHVISFAIGIVLMLGLGYFFNTFTDAKRPYEDAFSTGFSFVASYLEAQRILSGWLYWIVLNAFSIWLYTDRGLSLYSGLALIYTFMSIYGYYSWKKASLNKSLSDSQIFNEPGF